MADQIYKVRDPSGNIREIKGPAGASDEEIISQAKILFGEPSNQSGIPSGRAPTREELIAQIPGEDGKPVPSFKPPPEPPLSLREKISGAIETPFAVGATLLSSPLVYLAGAGGPEFQQQVAQNIQYQPRTRVAQSAFEAVGKGLEASKLPPYMPMIGAPAGAFSTGARAVGDVARNELALAADAARPVVNALNRGRQAAAENLAGAASQITGGLSGKPAEAFRQAYKAGKTSDTAFLENLRGRGEPDQILTDIKQGISKIQSDNSAAYQNAKTGWAASTKPLSFDAVDSAFQRVKDSLQQGGKSKIGAAEQNVINEIDNVLTEWRNDPNARTALDFDALKQRIDAIYPESPRHTQAQRAVTDVRNAVKKAIVDETPEYADAMKTYETQLDMLRDINKALGAGDKVAKETAISKVMQVLKSSPSAEFKRQLVGELKAQGGVDILPSIAGQELSAWMPTSGLGKAVAGGGLTSAYYLHHPELAAVLPFTSPRLMGEAYYGLGRLSGAGNRAAGATRNALAKLSNAAQQLSPAEIQTINALLQRGAMTQQPAQNALQR